jgi:hypothetical protein
VVFGQAFWFSLYFPYCPGIFVYREDGIVGRKDDHRIFQSLFLLWRLDEAGGTLGHDIIAQALFSDEFTVIYGVFNHLLANASLLRADFRMLCVSCFHCLDLRVIKSISRQRCNGRLQPICVLNGS